MAQPAVPSLTPDFRRRLIIDRLRHGTRSVQEIADGMKVSRPAVSQHLKVLKEAGLIRGDVDGPRVCYCIESRALRRFKALVGGL